MTAVGPDLLAGRRERLLLVGLVGFIALPLAIHLPWWIGVGTALLLVWQTVAHRQRTGPPALWLRALLTGGLAAAVFIAFGRINGQTAGVSLLVLMLALKLCELTRSRDALVVLSLCCFVLASTFLFSQSLLMAGHLVIGAWAIVAVFVYLHTLTGPDRARHAAGESATLLAWAIPVAAALFILFPRLPGPLWGLPSDSGATGVTGLSETMSPGRISQLARSDAVALRARFDGPVPPAGQRYWRGPVLWDFDSDTWANRRSAARTPAPQITSNGPTTQTTITLEASRQPWLIALDVPLSSDRDHRQTVGATLVTDTPIRERIQYTAESATRYRLGGPRLTPAERQRALRLPDHGNPRARALARRWAEQADDPRAIIEQALDRFRRAPYRYTLNPPPIPADNGIDAFLFDIQAGFCGHYAGALAFLMRAAGLPARVVTGYLGAEQAAYGDYWIVRDSDAHAWVEVWLANAGWVRVDPTAAVAPSRIERGLSGAVAAGDDVPFMARGTRDNLWVQARLFWDAVNAGWNQWFLAYGPTLQKRLFGWLGLSGFGPALAVLTFAIVALLTLASTVMAYRTRWTRVSRDPVVAAWHRLDRRLGRLGLAARVGETSHHHACRVAAARPDLGQTMHALAARYRDLRYAPGTTTDDRRDFLRAARRFRPRRRR